MNRLTATIITLLLATSSAFAQGYATKIRAEVQTAGEQSLRALEWQQGSTPLIRVEPLDNGRPIAADTNMNVRMIIGESATAELYAVANASTATGNYYEIQWPTIGTNTTDGAWWYTIYFEKEGRRYWTGNGELYVNATTSTAQDGLHWQEIVCSGTEVDPIASPIAYTALTNAATAQAMSDSVGLSDGWITVEGGTGVLYRTNEQYNLIVTETSGEGYNGPEVGTVFYYDEANSTATAGHYASSSFTAEIIDEQSPSIASNVGDLYWYGTGAIQNTMYPQADAVGTLTINTLATTNAYTIATLDDVSGVTVDISGKYDKTGGTIFGDVNLVGNLYVSGRDSNSLGGISIGATSRTSGEVLGLCAFEQGNFVKATGRGSKATGAYTIASGNTSEASGAKAVSTNVVAFTWNGSTHEWGYSWYYDHGAGTFNINPVGGLAGFYVGETNLSTTLAAKASTASVALKQDAETIYTGAVCSASSGTQYYWTTGTNVTLSVGTLTAGKPVNIAKLNNTATNSIIAIGKTGWEWTGGEMTNTITAGKSMTFGFLVDPSNGKTNAYATGVSK